MASKIQQEVEDVTLRENGRKNNENREIVCQIGIVKNSSVSGSALFQIGNTKVAAFVNGPHQITQRGGQAIGSSANFGAQKGLLNVRFFVTNFSAMDHRSDIKRDNKIKEFQRSLKSAFESVIMLESYPRSQIDLQICVLESDGSFKSAAFNAVSLALMNAGIAMKDYLVATTSGLMGNVAVLDLIYQEEKK